MRILNLYAGLGGNRKLWSGHEVTSVEKNEKIAGVYRKLYPDDRLVIADAHEYLLNNYSAFDVVWSSPPCQKHSKMTKATRHHLVGYIDLALYQEIILLDNFFKGIWVVENVKPYYKPLIPPTATVGRHLFWSNREIQKIDPPQQPKNFINECTVSGSEKLKHWLGIRYEGNLYYENNHCPAQVLRNCVHPEIGLAVLNQILNT